MITIGINAPNSIRVRNIITALVNQLNLLHVCMQTPVNRAIAGLLDINVHDLTRHTEPHRHYKQWGANMAELDARLCLLVRHGNPLCFIEYTEQHIAELLSGPVKHLTSGIVISGIGTNTEAQWLRDQGGTLLHIYDPQHLTQFCHLPVDARDVQINAGLSDKQFMAQLAADLQQLQEAA